MKFHTSSIISGEYKNICFFRVRISSDFLYKMMKAAYYTQYGGPENFSIKEIDIPHPGDHDLLIEVHTATVNRSDCAILEGSWIIRPFTGLTKPKKPCIRY